MKGANGKRTNRSVIFGMCLLLCVCLLAGVMTVGAGTSPESEIAENIPPFEAALEQAVSVEFKKMPLDKVADQFTTKLGIEPGSWDAEQAAIRTIDDKLIVHQTLSIHRKIYKLLRSLDLLASQRRFY